MLTKLQLAILDCIRLSGPCPKPVIVRYCQAKMYHTAHIDKELQRLSENGKLFFSGFNFSLTNPNN